MRCHATGCSVHAVSPGRGGSQKIGTVLRAHVRPYAHCRTQRAEQRAVRYDQDHRRQRGRAIDRRHRATSQRGERLGTLRRERTAHPVGEPAAHGLAFLHAERHLAQVGIECDREAQRLADEFGRDARTRQRRCHDRCDAASSQLVRRRACLCNAGRIQRDIDVALRNALGVPVGLAMPEKPERNRRERGILERPVHVSSDPPAAAHAAPRAAPSSG